VTTQIPTAVADREGVDKTELPPLYDTIDPYVLDTLFRNGSGNVVFEYCEYMVTVDHEENVEVVPVETR